LTILSFFFWIGTIVRKHLLRKKQSNIPIVTVGNISFGGTGKTPFLLYLLKYLDGSACYVSRGYGRKSKGNFVGKWPSCTYEACGDEAMQVTRRFSSTVLSIAADKWQAIQNVPDGTRLILLDDGLQRYDIPKVVEIATVDVQNPDGLGGLFPRGLLREPMSRLKKVDYLVLTNLPPQMDPERVSAEYRTRFGRPTIVVMPKLVRFFTQDGKSQQIQPGAHVALFSSIASPHRARVLMERCNFVVVEHLVYPDHMDIEEETLYTYAAKIQTTYPEAVLMGTEKDFVKKKSWPHLPLPLVFSELDLEIVAGEEEFQELLGTIKKVRL
jgi:tetraacyldisaccharide 4'-kinase